MIKEVPLVIGTAGHIDHGKTTLVRALTGVDLDSREEEKRRGITIELGFTPLELPDGRIVSLVDVPGHEKLIRQMVAGASGLDAVMLVVASDEGVMPQTREHVDILGLLGVKRGLVVLTKTDVVEPELRELAREDLRAFLKGTFLEEAPVVEVSSLTGQGLDDLRAALAKLTKNLPPRTTEGAYFLPVDRVFPVAGFGTVVTGTSTRGIVALGEEMELLPRGRRCKVRSLQVHGQKVDRALAGQRTALCLTDLQVSDVQRGDVVATAGVFRKTDCLEVVLSVLPAERKPITHWQRVRLHLGTSDVLARVALLSGKTIEPGQSAPAQLVTEEPVVAALGQRFVLRFYSPLRTLGGGEVTNPYGRKPGNRAARLERAETIARWEQALTPRERLVMTLDELGLQTFEELTRRLQCRAGDLRTLMNALEQKGEGRYLPLGEGVALSARTENRHFDEAKERLEQWHAAYPHLPGLAADELISKLYPEPQRRMGRMLLDRWLKEGRLNECGGLISLPGFRAVDGEAFEKAKGALKDFCDGKGFTPPTLEEVKAALGMEKDSFIDLVEQLKKSRDVALLDGTFLITDRQLNKLIGLVAGVEGGFALADVKALTGASRKYTMPMMEHLDRLGVTRRVGDKRVVLRRDL